MGLFLGNLHILSKNLDGQKVAIQALSDLFAELGYEATSDPKLSQVNVTIITSADLRWTSACSEQWHLDPSLLSNISAGLSKQAKAPVLSVLINDSDTIWMALYQKGIRLDGFTNAPDQEGEDCGKPQKWESILGAAEQEQLHAIWDAPYTFIEEMLPPLAGILKIPEEQLCALADELQNIVPQAILHFRKPDQTENTAVGQICVEALGQVTGSFAERKTITVGELYYKQSTFVNRGLAFTGFTIVIDGSAVRNGIVSLSRMVAKYFASSDASAHRIGLEQYAPLVDPSPDGSAILCQFNELKVTDPGDPEDRFRMTISLFLKGDKEASGEVRVRMIPHADPSAAVGFEYAITVEASFRKPLKFAGDANYLRQMATQKYALGVAIAGEDQEIFTDALAAFEQLLAVYFTDRKTLSLSLTTRKSADPTGRPRKQKLDATDLMHSKQWKNVTKDYHNYQLINAEVEDRCGIICQIPSLSRQERACEHICLWVYAPKPVHEYEEIIAGAIRQTMRKHALQGFISGWNWIPLDNSWTTPYERACGSGIHRGTAAECARRVCALGNKVWIGAELLDRVGGIASLEKLAGVTYRAPYAEVALNSNAEFDQAEAVLEAILPSAERP